MIKIGTSGYSYRDWIENFYPKNIKQNQMLKYYSQFFNFTEINSTYYRIPDARNFYKMAEVTGYDFTFSVKLHSTMTHSRDCLDLEYKKFHEALSALNECDKLSVVIAQFPNSFNYTKENEAYLLKLADRFKDFRFAVEFRNNSFVNVNTLKTLRENQITYICVDEPKINGLLAQNAILTSKTGYIRFHGRNTSKWYNNNESQERYDYLYGEKELMEWIPPIKGMEHSSDDLFISFNNHFNGQAVINANAMKKLLGL